MEKALLKGKNMENNFTKYRIVSDSAADLTSLDYVPFASAPLKVITAEKEYLDIEGLDVLAMVDYLKGYKGKSSSSCPNPDEWLKAFGDSEYIFGVAITSGLSGSFNAAQIAKEIYESEHPERHVFILDSLSAGPEQKILVEKLEELIVSGKDYESICKEITEYRKSTNIFFVLQSFTNFANNGRVSPAVAKIAGMLGICIVATASDVGTIEITDKCRGMSKSLDKIVEHLKQSGFKCGKIRIAHCFNKSGAEELKGKILKEFGSADIKIYETHGLCSFYAEKGGILVGFDTV